MVVEGRLEKATQRQIEEHWRQAWGLPLVSVRRDYLPADVEGLVWRDELGTVQGVVAWAIDGEAAEIVSIEAFQLGTHVGGRLLDGAETELRRRGVRRVTIVTTNDNLRALAFYVRRGYRLVAVHPDAMDLVREKKPRLPQVGNEGIPLRDMWELEKHL